MTEYLERKTSSFLVKDLRNSQLLPAIRALKEMIASFFHASPAGMRRRETMSNLNNLNLNLFHPDLFSGFLKKDRTIVCSRYLLRRRLKSIFFTTVLICGMSFNNCVAEKNIYKYIDHQDRINYSDTPPANGVHNVEILQQEPDAIEPGKPGHLNTTIDSRPSTSQPSPKVGSGGAVITGYPLWQVGLFLILLIIPAAFLQFYMLPRLRGNSFQQATIGVLAKNHLPAQHNLRLTLESGERAILPHLIYDHSGLVCLHNKPQAEATAITRAIEKLSDGVPVHYILLVEDASDVDINSGVRTCTLSGVREMLRTLPIARYTPKRIEAAFTTIGTQANSPIGN